MMGLGAEDTDGNIDLSFSGLFTTFYYGVQTVAIRRVGHMFCSKSAGSALVRCVDRIIDRKRSTAPKNNFQKGDWPGFGRKIN